MSTFPLPHVPAILPAQDDVQRLEVREFSFEFREQLNEFISRARQGRSPYAPLLIGDAYRSGYFCVEISGCEDSIRGLETVAETCEQTIPCQECSGDGYIEDEECPECGGAGRRPYMGLEVAK